MAISKKLRFDVLKRDDFACQYCGRTAEETKMTIDHIISIADGGKDTFVNLVSCCMDCNMGKGSRSVQEMRDKIQIKTEEFFISNVSNKIFMGYYGDMLDRFKPCFFCGEDRIERLHAINVALSPPGALVGIHTSFCKRCLKSLRADEFWSKLAIFDWNKLFGDPK